MTLKSAVNPQVTHWCATYFFNHQYPTEDLLREDEMKFVIEKIKKLGLIYGIFGLEQCPTTKKYHLQIAFITTDRFRWEQMQRLLTPMHVEAMRKAAWRSKRYCKKDGNFTEIGELPGDYQEEGPSAAQVATDILELCKRGDEQAIVDKYPAHYLRQYNTIQKVLLDFEEWHPVGKKTCIWIYSKDFFRTGKSTFLARHFPAKRGEVYWHPQFAHSDFWERYKRNTHTVVFDDLDMSTAYIGSQLKRLTSDTPNIVNVKVAVHYQWSKIFLSQAISCLDNYTMIKN